MKFNQLNATKHRRGNRVGRGIAAGQGKTAGRGTKGQKARSGNGKRPGFEGGQNPLMQRLPKLRGFRSLRPKAELVYTGQLQQLGGTVDNHTAYEAGLISSPYVRVKLVQRGDLQKKVNVSLQLASAGAIAAVQKAGGSFTATEQLLRPKKDAKPE